MSALSVLWDSGVSRNDMPSTRLLDVRLKEVLSSKGAQNKE